MRNDSAAEVRKLRAQVGKRRRKRRRRQVGEEGSGEASRPALDERRRSAALLPAARICPLCSWRPW